MTAKHGVCHSHRPCWCPLCSDYLVLCVYTAGVCVPCPPLVWVRGQSLLFLHPPTLSGEWMSHCIDHLLKASNGTREENPIPRYWCPSCSPLFWRRVPQTSCLLISVSSFIGDFTVYPECSIPIHILSIVRKTGYIQSICFSTETKHTIYPTLEIVSPNLQEVLLHCTWHVLLPNPLPLSYAFPQHLTVRSCPLCSWNVCVSH